MVSRFSAVRALALGTTLMAGGALVRAAVVPATIERVSISTAEQEATAPSYGPLSASDDGRFVVFTSRDRALTRANLPAAATQNVYLRDRKSGFTELVSRGDSRTTTNALPNGDSYEPSVSGDGRFVAFATDATNLIGFGSQYLPDINGNTDIYVRDRRGTTIRVSGPNEIGDSRRPQISRDGTVVAFTSDSFGLVPGDARLENDVYVAVLDFDTNGALLGVDSYEKISSDATGTPGDAASELAGISADGQYVLFHSLATNLAAGDTNNAADLFLRDRSTGEVRIVSRASDVMDDEGNVTEGAQGNGASTSAALSSDGRYVAFISTATNLVEEDTNGAADVFIRDLETGETRLVSLNDDGEQGDDDSAVIPDAAIDPNALRPFVSDDGRFVGFASSAANLVFDDNNLVADYFIRDLQDESTSRLSSAISGAEGDAATSHAFITPNGRYVALASDATNLVGDDSNAATDVFLLDLGGSGGGNGGPVASAGQDQDVFENSVVTLDASGSTDPNNDPLTYTWRQVGGATQVTLTNANTAQANFTAPLVNVAELLEFEVTVSDGTNPPVKDRVAVVVSTAPPGSIVGRVTAPNGNAVIGATVDVVRSDGERATLATTDGIGNFRIVDARVGANTITVTAPGFDTAVRQVDVLTGSQLTENFTLANTVATVEGTILLADGAPLVGATVRLLGARGEILGTDATDATGEYRIPNLDRFATEGATAIEITHPRAIRWVAASPALTSGVVNQRDFQYGSLQVRVDTRPRQLRSRLNGSRVEILIGDQVAASNRAGRRNRTLTFTNVPATQIRVRATNPNLTGAVKNLTIQPGRLEVVTIRLRRRGRF